MGRENGIKIFRGVVFIIVGFIFGLVVSVFAWVNPSQNPPLGGGVLQTDTSGFKIVTTTQITTGNFTVNNGNVGIGTTAPATKLDVAGTVTVRNLLEVRRASDGTNAGTINLFNSTSGNYWHIPVRANEGDNLNFYNWDGATWRRNMALQMGGQNAYFFGNVGIGTTAPSQRLTVVGNIGIQAGSNAFIGTLDNYALSLRTNNTDRIFITNAGNVGIGTTAPGAKLHVHGGNLRITGSENGIELQRDSDNSIAKILYVESNTPTSPMTPNSTVIQSIGGSSIHLFPNYYAPVNGLTVNYDGNVGIGTTAPGGKLGILSGWGNWIRFDDSVSGNRYMFHNPSDGSRFEIGVYDASAATNRWGVFVIRPSGNVGIGTTNPNNLLQVFDLINFNNTDFNTFLGYRAGKNVVSGAQYNTFIGYQAGFSSSTTAVFNNTAIGSRAFYSNTSGSENTALGYNALFSNTSGGSNTAIGSYALYHNTTGNNNTALGNYAGTRAGYYGLEPNFTSTYSVYLGAYTMASFSGATNEIVIGYAAMGAGSNSVVLGNDSITRTILKGNVGIGTTTPYTRLTVVGLTSSQAGRTICSDTSGNFYYYSGSCVSSSIKYKTNIQNLGIGLETLLKLRPVTFEFKKDYGGYDGTTHMGFIAEEVEQVTPILVDYNNGEVSGVRYSELTALIVKSIQEQQKEIEDLKKEIEELKKMITR
jgi:hypothetical protein